MRLVRESSLVQRGRLLFNVDSERIQFMQIKKGHDRVVILFPFLKIAIKFPIISFWRAIHMAYSTLSQGGWEYLKQWLDYPLVSLWGFKRFLFGGLAANWSEFWFYHKTHHPFLQPTYLSLGFVNVQRCDELCELQVVDFRAQLYRITNHDVLADPHHFSNPRNFCFNHGTLRMLDYGAPAVQGIILKHGAAIMQRVDPKFSYEAEKARRQSGRQILLTSDRGLAFGRRGNCLA